MSKTCTHTDQINLDAKAATLEGCEECLKTGDTWVQVRMCMTCGRTGCCDSSKNTHARKHFTETQHPIIQSSAQAADWKWCYIDDDYITD